MFHVLNGKSTDDASTSTVAIITITTYHTFHPQRRWRPHYIANRRMVEKQMPGVFLMSFSLTLDPAIIQRNVYYVVLDS